ncbi:MAG: caspase family protein, partial [Methylobacteriaceae bacterium]|nr:caspase family protein [Methylobacteriaceae bacterium]
MIRLASVTILIAAAVMAVAAPAQAERRLALVIGQSAYPESLLATAANDAGLIAEALRAAGFEVTGLADADQTTLRQALRDFAASAVAAGPESTSFVYVAARGLQFDGETYLAPVDARIRRDTDIPVEGVRASDFIRSISGAPARARFMVLDAARANPFPREGAAIAGGLALTEAEPGTLIAFNAAPGTVAPPESGPYGVYALALAEALREGGLSADALFQRVRLRVVEQTKGAQAPWHVSAIAADFTLLDRAAGAPAPAPAAAPGGAAEAFALAVQRDTIEAYQGFIAAWPSDPLARKARAMLAARREALTWRKTISVNSPESYWSYLRRYPKGPHAADARRRLTRLQAQLEPPPGFDAIAYDVPPPPREEYVLIEDRPVVVFEEFEAPPRVFLRDERDWAPPPPPPAAAGPGLLPLPIPIPLPMRSRLPAAVPPPPPVGLIGPRPIAPPAPASVTPNVGPGRPSAAPQPLTPSPGAAPPRSGIQPLTPPPGARPGFAPPP